MARPTDRRTQAAVVPDHAGRHRRARPWEAGQGQADGRRAGGESDLSGIAGGVARQAEVSGDDAGAREVPGDDAGAREVPGDDAGAREVSGDDAGGREVVGGREGGDADPAAPGVPLFAVPDSLRGVDVAVGGRAARGLLLVAVVLLAVLGGRWWWVQQQASGVPVEHAVGVASVPDDGGPSAQRVGGSAAAGGTAAPAGALAAAAPAAPAGERADTAAPAGGHVGTAEEGQPGDPVASDAGQLEVMVHVIGRVREPGVVELPWGARVIDAVEAAGGVTDEADPASLNLARPVVDGEQVWVGAPGEEPPPGVLDDRSPAAPQGAVGGGAQGAGTGEPGGSPLDLNRTDQAQLEELPGVGPVTAGNILAWREAHGRFTAVDELMEVSGIGEKTFERLRPHVTVGG